MLDFLRQQIKSPIFQAIIIIIVLVFLFWVPQMGSGNNRDSVAVVNGEPISFNSFNRNYNQMVDRLREQFQGNLPSDFVEKFGVKKQILQRLIRDELLLQGATKMGIHVSNWEIQEQIKHQEFFLTDGVFDKKKYNDLLVQNKLSAKKYEASQRLAILHRKATQALSTFAVLTEWETTTRFQYYLNEIKLNYGILTPDLFKDQVKLDDDKINAYFDQHKENYKTAPEIKLSYLSFSLADAMAQITIHDDAIKNYYEKNKEKYSIPEQRQVRHILLKTDGTNDAAQKTKAEEILKKLQNGGNFAALAKEFSDDPGSKNKGGELDFFSKGQMIPTFETITFSLAKNQISDIVKTRFGYHIIQLLEIHPPQITPLDDVRTAIIASMKQEQAKGKAFEEAGTAYEKIFQAGSLTAYAKNENITLPETDFFTQAKPATSLENRPQLLKKAFSLKKGELSSMIESHDGYYILYVTDTIEPKIPAPATVRDEIVRDFTTAEATIIAKNTATAILAVAREEGLEAALTAKNIDMKTSPWFSRQQSSSSNLPKDITTAGFSLSTDNQYPEKVLVHNNQFYIISFADLKITQASNKSQAEMFKDALRQEKQLKILNSWLDHLQDTSTIKINKEFMAAR